MSGSLGEEERRKAAERSHRRPAVSPANSVVGRQASKQASKQVSRQTSQQANQQAGKLPCQSAAFSLLCAFHATPTAYSRLADARPPLTCRAHIARDVCSTDEPTRRAARCADLFAGEQSRDAWKNRVRASLPSPRRDTLRCDAMRCDAMQYDAPRAGVSRLTHGKSPRRASSSALSLSLSSSWLRVEASRLSVRPGAS